MKKNKTVAYILAATLLVGGTFAGTKALFSDTETTNNPLILTTGKVDISVKADETWKKNVVDKNKDGVISAADDLNNYESEGTSFDNVKPGDTFTKYVNIINRNSTYDVNLTFEKNLNGLKEKFIKCIEIVSSVGNTPVGSQLDEIPSIPAKTNTGGFVTIRINDNKEAQELLNGAGQLDLNAAYQITATQAN